MFKQDERKAADGMWNTAGDVGPACSPPPSLLTGTDRPGLATPPPSSSSNAWRQLQGCLTSDVFCPGLKMSVDVLLARDKHAGL